eukprot:COSAG04_NODE_360_length_15920_cov_50.432815_5_plen_202_part_00
MIGVINPEAATSSRTGSSSRTAGPRSRSQTRSSRQAAPGPATYPNASAALYTSLVQKKEAAPRIWPVTVLYDADDPTVCALQEACEMEAKLKMARVKGLVFTAMGCLIGVFSFMAFEASLALEQEVLGAACVGLVVVATLGGCCCRRSVAKNCKWVGAPLKGHDISGGTRRCCGCGRGDIGQERIWLEMSDDDSVENPMRK